MKIYGKLILTACGVALATSAMTVTAMQSAMDALAPQQSDPDSGDTRTLYTRSSGSPVQVSQRPGTGTDFTVAAEKAIGGVVSIKSYVNSRRQQSQMGSFDDFFSDPFFDFFFGNPGSRRQQTPKKESPKQEQDDEPQQQLGLGSGVIISPDGYIVTNAHVINGADRLEITLNDNSTYNAKVIGSDKSTDLALIKIEAKDLPVIPFGDSDALKVGEWVLAVGNPFG